MSVLKYTAYDGMGRLPREEVAAAQHGRQLRAGGVLSGALHTLGYVRAASKKIEHQGCVRQPSLTR